MPRILQVKKIVERNEANKYLPNPLVAGERVIVHPDQSGIDEERYVRLKRPCLGKSASVFNWNHFIVLK